MCTHMLSWQLLSTSEIGAMALDGELWRTESALCDLDLPDDVHSRIRFAGNACPTNVVFARLSAAWIWECADTLPSRWTIASADRTRLTTMPNDRYAVCDLRFAPDDVTTIGLYRVTSVERTAMDIARYENDLPEDRVNVILQRLLARYETTTSTQHLIDRVINAKHLPYKVRCLNRLRSAIDGLTKPGTAGIHNIVHGPRVSLR